jgi:hypothetical protein
MRNTIFPVILFLSIIIFPAKSYSQFYKIYGYATPDAGETELVYWTTVIPSSDLEYNFFGEDMSREGLMAHSFEIEYGLSNRFTVAAYIDFEHPKDGDFKQIRTKAVLAQYRFYEKGSRPLDLAVYFEYILPREEYGNSEELEIKLILEKDIKNITLVTNPTFEKKVSGDDITEGLEFNFSGGIYYRESLKYQPGIEFYTRMGEIRETRSFDNQKAYIFPTLDIFFKQQFNWHFGAGLGLSDNSDNFLIKSIFSYEF